MEPQERRSESIEELALVVFLLACALLSFFKDLFPVLEHGLTAAIFVAAFFILKQLRDLRLELRARRDSLEKYYPSPKEFYASAARAADRATDEICATYFRDAPPSDAVGEESLRYFDKILTFARKRGTVRRIIKVTNPELAEWCQGQGASSQEIARYNVRVMNPAPGSIEPMNMAIFDRKIIYLAFAGSTESQLGGVRPGGTYQAQFLQARFDEHWRLAIPIGEYMQSGPFRALLPKPGGTNGAVQQ